MKKYIFKENVAGYKIGDIVKVEKENKLLLQWIKEKKVELVPEKSDKSDKSEK